MRAVFSRQSCGHSVNADINAACVLKVRGVRALLADDWAPKAVRRTLDLGRKSAAETSGGDPAIDKEGEEV